MMTANQIRAARGLLNWQKNELAAAAGLSQNTITNIESERFRPQTGTLEAIRGIFERHGVEFLDNNGVRLKERRFSVLEGNDAYLHLLDDVFFTLKDSKGEALFLGIDDSLSSMMVIQSKKRILAADIPCKHIVAENSTIFNYPLQTYRLLPEKYFSPNAQVIYADKIGITTRGPNDSLMVMVVHDEQYAESQRKLFAFLWEVLNCP